MSDITDWSEPVQKVLFQTNQFMGVGLAPAMFILILTIVLMNMVSFWCFIIGVILFLIAKIITKNDDYALLILFDRILNHPSVWRAS